MNSAIHLCQSPLPVAPGLHSSASRVHVSLSHASLSVSQSSKRSHLVSSPSLHMKSRLPGFSDWSKMNEEIGKKNNIVRGRERGASPAMAWVLGAFSLSGSDQAGDPEMAPWEKLVTGQYLEREPSLKEIEALKIYAMGPSKEDGDKILRKVCEKWKESSAEGPLLMAHAELLAYQEKYEEASQKLEELSEIVKRDEQVATPGMWKNYHILKDILHGAKVGGKDDGKAKQLWRDYCNEINTKKPEDDDFNNFPAPSGFPKL